ncbi:MAG TPA: efflux RND transporter periplasmic adaptor subunit [Nitrospiria bacterium]|jgi:RND family efflux transporter MFP subunit
MRFFTIDIRIKRDILLTSFFLFFFLLFESPPLFAQGKFPPTPVKVAEVTQQTLVQPLTLVGTVEPRTQSVVASEVEGLVESFPIEEGTSVRKGDLFASLRTDTLEIQLRVVEAQRNEAQARYQRADSDLERSKRLFFEKVLSEKVLQDGEAEAEAWAQKISQHQAEMDQLKDQIKKSKIIAPYDGEITQTHTQIGEWLSKGGAVAEIIDLSHVRIIVGLPEKYIRNIRVGENVQVSLDALPDRPFSGKIFSIISKADLESRTFPIKIELENKKGELKSGLLARVSLPVGPPVQTLTVPKDALVIKGGQTLVFIANKTEKGWTVSPVNIKTGLMVNNWVEVQGPLNIGQKVVIRGNERLRPGQEVNVME